MKKIVKLSLITAISLSLLSGCGKPETFEDAQKAYYDRDYKKAISIFENLANEGDLKSQKKIADIFDYGIGKDIEINKEKALKYYEKAAWQGDEISLNKLINNDSKVAKDILSKKAKEGDSKSLEIIIKKYPKESISILEEQANKGDVKSQFLLGDIYINGGEGIDKDLVKASQWYEKSAKEADYISQIVIAIKYSEINAKEKYKEWLEKTLNTLLDSAQNGNSKAQLNLGLIYLNNGYFQLTEHISKDINELKEKYIIANFEHSFKNRNEGIEDIRNSLRKKENTSKDLTIEWLEKAANQDDKEAQKILIGLYEKRNFYGTSYYNFEKAFEWYEKLANKGDIDYQDKLATMYYKGENVKQDFKKAFEWAEKSANQGSISGQYNLGALYFFGKGVEQDYKKAIELFEKSANQGSSIAQNTLGEIYIEGKGVEANKTKAYQYWSMAKDKSFKAKENIDKLCSDPFNAEICKNEK